MSEYPDVCLVTNPIGATDNAVGELLDILSELTAVSLLTVNLPRDSRLREDYEYVEVARGREIHNIVLAAWYFVLNQVRMCHAIRRSDEDVVWFFGATSYVLPILFARVLGRTVVVQPRGNIPLTLRIHWERRVPDFVAKGLAGVVWLLERIGYRLADHVVTYTPSMADSLELDPTDESVHPDGARFIDTDSFAPTVDYDDRDMVIGFLGRLDEEKGIRTLVEAVEQLPDEITFRFIGGGPLREWVERRLASKIESGAVEVVGWVDHDEVPEELSKLQLLVLPSHPTEGLPTVILESMACGTPVYATPVSGVPDVVIEGETGYLMMETDPESIAAEVASLVDSDGLAPTSANARSLITSTYDFDAARDRYEEIFRRL